MSTTAPVAAAGGSSPQPSPLGIICAGGSMPFAVADAVIRRGRPVMLFALNRLADTERVNRYPHRWIWLGQLGRFKRLAREHGCRDFVWIGSLYRPSLWQLRFDLWTLMVLPQIIAAFRGGDDHMLTSFGRIFERHGFRLVGAHEVAPDILAPSGTLTQRGPTDQDRVDIARGMDLLAAIGRFDVGQGAVVAGNHVLAVEGLEGTDGMLARIAKLRKRGRLPAATGTGVLVKAAKPDQDRRFDLPTIGPQTVEAVEQAGLGGIAVVAGETVVAELERMLAAADKAGLFIVGVEARQP